MAEKAEKADKDGAEHVIKDRGMISLHEELFVTFFIEKKVTKKSSRSKNSLGFPITCFPSWYAVTPVSVPRCRFF
jgi:hypothetical protein